RAAPAHATIARRISDSLRDRAWPRRLAAIRPKRRATTPLHGDCLASDTGWPARSTRQRECDSGVLRRSNWRARLAAPARLHRQWLSQLAAARMRLPPE